MEAHQIEMYLVHLLLPILIKVGHSYFSKNKNYDLAENATGTLIYSESIQNYRKA